MTTPARRNLFEFKVGSGMKSQFPMPRGVKRVDRRTRWGNPFRIGELVTLTNSRGQEFMFEADRPTVIALYRHWAQGQLADNPNWLEPLRGKDLACWCAADLPCHVDVLMELLYPLDMQV